MARLAMLIIDSAICVPIVQRRTHFWIISATHARPVTERDADRSRLRVPTWFSDALKGEAYPHNDNQTGLFRANALQMPLHIQPCACASLPVMEQGSHWNHDAQQT